MRHIVICGLPILLYFSTLSQNGKFFEKKKVAGHKMCFLIFPTNLSETFLILIRIKQDVTKKNE
jgi:hypothetical protein